VRTLLTSGAAIAVLIAALGPADAGYQRAHAKREHVRKDPPPKPLQVPIIAVSIANQHLTVYDKGVAVAHAPVSTGMAGHSTPTGIFSVIGKEIFHRSNIYSGAPMPFMQRITWSGVALHAGVLPGYPASHGCIRLPPEFAVKLFGLTRMGARVLITHGEVVPAPFEDGHLFALARPPVETTGEVVMPPAPVRTAESTTSSVRSDAADVAAGAFAGPVAAQPAAEPPKQAPAELPESLAAAAREAARDAANAAAREASGNAAADTSKDTIKDTAKDPSSRSDAAPVAPQGDSKEAAKDAIKDATKDGATGTVLVTPVQVAPQQPTEAPNGFDKASIPAKPAETTDAGSKPAPSAIAELEPYGPERPLRPGPITVFVSKKEGKVFVRKAFQPVLTAPVTIANPEIPLGTHIFTATDAKADGVSFDWLAVSMPAPLPKKAEVQVARDRHGRRIDKVVAPDVAPPPSSTAAEALARIEIPPYALARISALMSAGASLIVSDQGLGYETGTETDFIVVTR
jgi:hypothetical protein